MRAAGFARNRESARRSRLRGAGDWLSPRPSRRLSIVTDLERSPAAWAGGAAPGGAAVSGGQAGARATDPELAAAAALARWMDDRFLDPLLGLFLPGAGDVLGTILGIYPVWLAWRRGAPMALLARMLLNLAVDALGGAVPIVGDIWDFLFRAHARNLALLEARASGGEVRGRPTDALVVAGAALLLVAALAAPIVLAVALVRAVAG
jgi:hypothetical protein